MTEPIPIASATPLRAVAAGAPQRLLALHAFERIDTRALAKRSHLLVSTAPTTLRFDSGAYAVCLRYGVVVFALSAREPYEEYLDLIASLGNKRTAGNIETEELTLALDATGGDRLDRDKLYLSDGSIARLQVCAEVLARSVVMASYESSLRGAAGEVEPFLAELSRNGKTTQSPQALLRQVGQALSTRQALIGRAEVMEKPELLWERPDLERLYHQLMNEYEVEERNTALDGKLFLIADAAKTGLDLVRHRSALRVEWYIVALIVIEILLTLSETFWH